MSDSPTSSSTGKELATLGGGCFWCLEAVYDQVKGIESVESGYMGGGRPNPTYEAVCTGTTGHAEVIQIRFEPGVITYRELLEIFFGIHDPTTLNRQGNDAGTQYRSVIFTHSSRQEATANEVIRTLTQEKIFDNPIVTQVVPASPFYIAEDYHQEYFARNPSQPYCAYLINPKVAKFRQRFTDKLKHT
ncbi:MAG: peptide-methionine (S)-S-oxide reductase MsrA [Nitrospirota bacterium]|jgi:peptide-methionine (S)-S-oxide reductase|nr:peptide-methionine (S)-S-oxide reductase MsrA [Nitrospirota bacterium]MDH4359232.1 peptide-methionine (S)-S-oxide reductase MsrA [Nitrospirota bacterium]MDH5575538.1 peptide-methionine (S)-S-oxide reductase MsrA [Nitrospirota bacterium]